MMILVQNASGLQPVRILVPISMYKAGEGADVDFRGQSPISDVRKIKRRPSLRWPHPLSSVQRAHFTSLLQVSQFIP